MEDCIFCKIANREIETDFILENEDFFAINDKFPKAPTHILCIPKKHVPSVKEMPKEEKDLLGSLLLFGQDVARKQGIEDFRLIFNNGAHSEIPHLHLHIISGQVHGGMVPAGI